MQSPDQGPFADLETLTTLAAQFGGDLEVARGVLAAAGVPVFNGVFSRGALLAAMGTPAAPVEITKPAGARDAPKTAAVLREALDGVGLEGFDLASRRGLVGKIRPRRGDARSFFYTPEPIDLMKAQEDDGHLADAASFYAEDFVAITDETPKSIRVFTTSRAHQGLAHFTVAASRATEVDFGVFIELDDRRVWIVPTEDMRKLIGGEHPLTHAHLHGASGSIRFAFPRRATFCVLSNRILAAP